MYNIVRFVTVIVLIKFDICMYYIFLLLILSIIIFPKFPHFAVVDAWKLFLVLAVLERQRTVKGYANSLDRNKLATLWKKNNTKNQTTVFKTQKKKTKDRISCEAW